MSIFSRWALTPCGADECPSDRGRERKEAGRDARNGSASLVQFLEEQQLIPMNETQAIERGRKRVEESGLLQIMFETCAAINRLAGRTVVDVHSFLPPDPILCCFIVVERGTEYFIRLEVQGETPTLTFAERKWRDTVTNDFLRWACRLAETEPVTINVKLVHEFRELRVSVEQVREWFMYLVSGMNRSHMPSF